MQKQNSVSITDLTFAWRGNQPDLAIDEFKIDAGETIFLHGASGSGKSTLLGLITGVLSGQSGALTVLGRSLGELSAPQRDGLRAQSMGVIFQQFNLVPYLTLIENVLLPCGFSSSRAHRTGPNHASRCEAAQNLLERLGVGAEAREGRAVSALSVGQQQRVAAARALIGAPALIIADEPTSALDAGSRDIFIETLLHEAKEASIVFVSHDASLAAGFDRTVSMGDVNGALRTGREV